MTAFRLSGHLPASAKYRVARVLGRLVVSGFCALGLAAPLRAQPLPAPPRLLRAADIDTLSLRDVGQRIAYGSDSLQFGELRLPLRPDEPRVPIAIILHGGCWISSFATVRNSAPLADALASHGIATWNVEYRRSDSPGGGWPGTFQDAAAAADYVRVLARQFPFDTNRIVIVGHSAGGHLALWLAGRRHLPPGSPLAGGTPLPIRGVVSLGGVVNLEEFAQRQSNGCGRGVSALLGGAPASVPDRLREASPILRVPLGVRTAHIAGEQDRIAPDTVLEAYRRAAETSGDSAAVIVSVPGGHFEVIAPHTEAGQTAVGLALAAVGRLPRRPRPVPSAPQPLQRPVPAATSMVGFPNQPGEIRMKDNQLKSLLKKTQAKASQAKKPAKQAYDSTLQATRSAVEADDTDAKEIFKEMKRREF